MLSTLLDIHTRSDDSLVLRRSRALALLIMVLVGISLLIVVVDPLISGNLNGATINLIAAGFFLIVFFINRSGQLTFALTMMLVVFAVLPIVSSVIVGSPIPTIFFACAAI